MGNAPGLALLRAEMTRQYTDGLASFEAAHDPAAGIAARIAQTGRLLMLGMGASHWANRIVVASYRSVGIRAYAEVLSEHMRNPLPPAERVTIITSQSGSSGEVKAYFDRTRQRRDHFGITLEPDGQLAKTIPCLMGLGGREKPFAATRSITITLALHVSILRHLGHDDAPLMEVLRGEPALDIVLEEAVAEIAGCRALFLSSRGQLHNVMEVAALTFMELARTPASALELGQLLHGPVECLSPSTALVLARPVGDDARGVTALAAAATGYGLRPVLFDIGKHGAVDGTIAIRLPSRDDLAGAVQFLPAVQSLVIAAAGRRVSDFGTPRRASKVTDGEAA